jgi:DNA polymerase-3 subunit epsilon
MPGNYDYEAWKNEKIRKGEWMTPDEYRKRKRGESEEESASKRQEVGLKSHGCLLDKPGFKVVVNKEVVEDQPKLEIVKSKEVVEDQPKLEIVKSEETAKDMKREFIFDTETTGTGHADKIVELSFIEMIDGIKTGRRLHSYFNPGMKSSKRALEIHGITNERLSDAPTFSAKAEDIIRFVGKGVIIAHNAGFDQRMLNNELVNAGWEAYPDERFIDTLRIARFLFPKHPDGNGQDALCTRFGVNNHNRETTGIHSAYEDTVLLYHVYLELKKLLEERGMTPYDFKIKKKK